MSEPARLLAALDSAAGQPAALATLIKVEGSSYRRPGARLLLLPDDTHCGSISGGCLEEDVLVRAHRVIDSGRPELAIYDTTAENDLVWGTGLGCQGVVHIFIERIPVVRPAWIDALRANLHARRDTALVVSPDGTRLATTATAAPGDFHEIIPAPTALLICGGGDDARPLARMAHELGWQVIVADSRPAYATAARFPEASRLLCAPLDQLVAYLPIDARTFAIVMTHRFADDRAFLHALLPRRLSYLGQLGPRSRTERLLAELAAAGFAPDAAALARLHAPVGLDLGGNTPETVALAILAEMQAHLTGRTPRPLRDRPGPIHG